MALLGPEALAQVGTVRRIKHGLITATDIAKFCSGIGEAGAEHHDEAAARAAGHPGIVAPPTFAAAATRPTPPRSSYLRDGQFDDVAPAGLGHLQTMLGGQDWTIHRLARAGETVEERRTITSMVEREGRTGAMAIVKDETAFTSADGEPIETLVSTLIVRPPPPAIEGESRAAPAQAGGSAVDGGEEEGPDTLVLRPDMIDAFLFAGAIWAVHRIHWDAPYARSEGLPTIILPGWMLSGYISRLARRLAPEGQSLARLAVSYRAMAHPGDTLTCTAGETDAEGLRAIEMTNQHGAAVASARVGYG